MQSPLPQSLDSQFPD